MTLAEFNERLKNLPWTDYVVRIKQKYDHEKEYDEFNTLLLSEDGYFVWQDDWNEGQQDVQILWFVAVDDVEQLPSAERKGKWIYTDKFGEWWQPIYRCSECGEIVANISNYCPNCGARMEGEDDDI